MATAQITSNHDTILAEVFIAAPPERVFEAIADPKQLAQWWGQKGVFHVVETKSDLRTGGKWSYEGVGPNNTPFHMEGKYVEVDPPRVLVQTRRADWVGDFETVVRWELEPRDVHGLHGSATHKVGTGTLVKVRHSGFTGHLDQMKSHHTGWSASLDWLAAYVEKGETMASRQ